MDAYIFEAVRTPRGSTRKNGSLHNITSIQLVEQLLQELTKRLPSVYQHAEDLILGCVTQIKGQGANIAKTAASYANLPYSVPGMTVNRFCTSGLDAIAIAAAKVHSQSQDVIIAGGVESVSMTPMFSDEGAWFHDREVSIKTKFLHMGISADLMAAAGNLQRDELDIYAVRSHQRAAAATVAGKFKRSTVAVKNQAGTLLEQDELIRMDASLTALAELKPSFAPFLSIEQRRMIENELPHLQHFEHVHHTGNSPNLADGASLIVIGNEQAITRLHKKPLAKIIGSYSTADHPMLLMGGQKAAEILLKKLNMTFDDIDAIEFYEAYAASAVKAEKDWQVATETFNPNGGVIATGHALGATGAMMICTLLDELIYSQGKYGLVTLSGGGGVGTAMVIERIM